MLNELIKLSRSDRGAMVCLKGGYPFLLSFKTDAFHTTGSLVHANVAGERRNGGISGETQITFNADDILYVQTLERR